MLYNIAGINVFMNPKYNRLKKQSEAYLSDKHKAPSFRIELSDEFLSHRQKENPHLSLEDCEYIWAGSDFYSLLPEFNGILLHASAVVHNNKAYLFSAPCGTGKSTHTRLWLKAFDDAFILNDDKPAIRICDGEILVFGTPFSGKTDLNINTSVPLGGICILERGNENIINRISPDEAIYKILNQTVRPYNEERMGKVLNVIDALISSSKVYKLQCNMDIEAAFTAYNGMK